MTLLMVWRRRKYAVSVVSASAISLLLLVCGIAGAKLLFFVESGFRSFGGMSFFGSIILVFLLMPVVGLLFRLELLQTLDFCAPCVASIISFMRFGCFCAGCCGGIMCTVGTYSFRWPTQLIEGFGDLAILMYLLAAEKKGHCKGRLYPMFLVLYGVLRFFVEFVRETPKELWALSEGQWLSLLCIIIGGSLVITLRRLVVK